MFVYCSNYLWGIRHKNLDISRQKLINPYFTCLYILFYPFIEQKITNSFILFFFVLIKTKKKKETIQIFLIYFYFFISIGLNKIKNSISNLIELLCLVCDSLVFYIYKYKGQKKKRTDSYYELISISIQLITNSPLPII